MVSSGSDAVCRAAAFGLAVACAPAKPTSATSAPGLGYTPCHICTGTALHSLVGVGAGRCADALRTAADRDAVQPQRDGTLRSAVSVWYVVALRSARPSGPRGPARAAMRGGEAAAMRGGEALVGFDHSAQRRHVARECGEANERTDWHALAPFAFRAA